MDTSSCITGLWLVSVLASSSFTPLGQGKTCSAGIFICQNSHLQLKINIGITPLQAIIKRLLAVFLVYSGSCTTTLFHFEILFSYFCFFYAILFPMLIYGQFYHFLIGSQDSSMKLFIYIFFKKNRLICNGIYYITILAEYKAE